MGLSNYIPSSRLIQPGVIANAGERPASPYEGMVVFQKDTNQTLVWDGSAWVMVHDTDQPPGMQLVSSGTMTNVGTGGAYAQNVFSADFDIHKVFFYDIIASTAIAVFMQFSNGTTENNVSYYSAGQYVLWANNGGANTSTNNGSALVLSSASTSPRSAGEWTFFNVAQANTTTFVAQKQNYDALENLGGAHSPATAFTGFRIYTSSGTVSLKYKCYGYRN